MMKSACLLFLFEYHEERSLCKAFVLFFPTHRVVFVGELVCYDISRTSYLSSK